MTKSRIDRRTFIAAGSAAVAGLAAPSLFAQGAASPLIISVGYWPRIQRMRAASNPLRTGIYAAESVTTSDPSFVRTGARIAIGELQRAGSGPLAVTVDVKQKADFVDEKVTFYASSYKSSPRGVLASSPVAFNVPVEMDQTLDLQVEVRTPASTSQRVIPFTVASVEGALKLNRGFYIVTIGDRVPDWFWLRYENERLVSAVDGAPAPFDYLVLTVSGPA